MAHVGQVGHAAGAKRRILVVEDEEDLASLVQVNLSLAGYDVIIAPTGEDGLRAIREEEPDAVLLDVMLPGIDGWNVLRTVKENRTTRDLPVVMLTALSEERDLIRGHLQGAVEYLTKPFEMGRLLETMELVLRDATEEELAERRTRIRTMLTRLAEIDSGRTSDPTVRLSGLERPPIAHAAESPEATAAQQAGLATLTQKQRWLASALGAGWGARQIAEHLAVSRSNVYATRRRVARRLGCDADDVADVAVALGITDEAGPPADEGRALRPDEGRARSRDED